MFRLALCEKMCYDYLNRKENTPCQPGRFSRRELRRTVSMISVPRNNPVCKAQSHKRCVRGGAR